MLGKEKIKINNFESKSVIQFCDSSLEYCLVILMPVSFTQSANDMKIFVLSKSPLKVRNITVYRFSISFLIPELLMSKD